jgi:hypothetical protein
MQIRTAFEHAGWNVDFIAIPVSMPAVSVAISPSEPTYTTTASFSESEVLSMEIKHGRELIKLAKQIRL